MLITRYHYPLTVVLTLFSLIAPLYIWLQTAGSLQDYWTMQLPPGQVFFIFSKLFALYALQFLWLQFVLALLKLDKRSSMPHSVHTVLGSLTVISILTHIGLFITAVAIRAEHFPVALLLPRFTSGFYNTAVSLGLIGIWMILIAFVAGMMVRHLTRYMNASRSAVLRWLHRLVYLALLCSVLHGFLIGSETRLEISQFIFAMMGLILLTSLFIRYKSVLPNYRINRLQPE